MSERSYAGKYQSANDALYESNGVSFIKDILTNGMLLERETKKLSSDTIFSANHEVTTEVRSTQKK